ncbi:MAG: A/G-specific adenine glycosylase [Lentisphaeria bacterium]|nr:A/G-specific adenine glycosylase [Lentisphaeria bacterium]
MDTIAIQRESERMLKNWPAVLLNWYHRERREMPWREDPSPYRVWISEIMLQQTQVATVIPYFERFVKRFPDVGSLAAADQQDVLKLWEGLGYYSRARNLHKGAKAVVAGRDGELPRSYHELLTIPGIGPYTAAAVASIAFGEPEAVVDGNVLRVTSRLWMLPGDPTETAFKKTVRDRLNSFIPSETPGDFNQAMMELGALVCVPREPTCPACPLNTVCQAWKKGVVDQFPRKRNRGKPPRYDVAVALIINAKGDLLVAQRRDDQMLGGMWELPGGKIDTGETPVEAVIRECLEELGVTVKPCQSLPHVRHAYSHFSVTLHPFVCELDPVDQRPAAVVAARLRWLRPDNIDELPFPKATLRVFDEWRGVVSRTV